MDDQDENPVDDQDENPVADCENAPTYGDANCDYWASTAGLCESDKAFMKQYCAKSCGMCGDDSNASVPEEDENPVPEEDENPVADCENNPLYGDPTCDYYATTEKFCESEPAFMNEYCAKSCGFCSDDSTPVESTETDAQDPPTETDAFTLIGESESCNKGVAPSSFGYGLSLEECAAACLNLGNCSYFIFDPTDGECAEEHTDNGCVGDRFEMSYYSLYEVK